MTELAEQGAATGERLATDAASQLSKANRYAFSFPNGARNVLMDEMLFAGNEFLDRAVAETRIFDEFLHKLAEAHSVKDYDVPGVHAPSARLHPPGCRAAVEA